MKLYFGIHLKHWWVYLISIGTLIFGYVFSMLGVFFLVSWDANGYVAFVIMTLIGNLIFSSPMVYVNYQVANTYCRKNKTMKNVGKLTAYNHFVTYIIFLAIFLLILYGGK